MGREIRRVRPDWVHPHGVTGYKPLQDGYRQALAGFRAMAEADGIEAALESYGGGPLSDDYMPDWAEAEATHYQMYENTTEGTPISPVFATPEEVARWCADNGASACGSMTATYDEWLAKARGGYAPTFVIENGVLRSGVAACAEKRKEDE